MKVKVVKNKVAPPFKSAVLEIMYGEGISYVSELIDLCVDANIIKKAGAWFSYEGEKIGQGKEAAKQYIKNNPDFMSMLEEKLKAYQNSEKEE